jgi:endonuclease/exonuclease/phosphatase family metal-dependent hydrolase
MKKFLLLFFIPFLLQAVTFKVATYNVENLFDMKFSGSEYVEYIPNGKYGWNRYIYQKKLKNIAKVIYDLNADVIALEEIESQDALLDLRKVLQKKGLFYRYYAIADKKNSTVKVALFSKFKITKIKEIKVSYQDRYRDILEVWIRVKNSPLILFVNHWKSKSAPESERIKYAKVLKKRVLSISKSIPYIILGDFNSNYNEYITFLKEKKLNNTHGKTGINSILKTIVQDKMVTIKDLKKDCSLLYNLWMELPTSKRYSYIFHGAKDSIDNIILPCSMFDGKGIEYIRNSFGVFKPNYLFKNGSIYRWQRIGGYGKFNGNGYSDHLPIYAYFSTDKTHQLFQKIHEDSYSETTIDKLYEYDNIIKPLSIKKAAVIYRDKTGVIIKKLHQRAIYVYRHNKIFKKGYFYNLVVSGIKRYKGNLEITSIKDATRLNKVKNLREYYLHYKKGMDLSGKSYVNEVIYKLTGVYDKGYLYYDDMKKLRIFSKIKHFYLKNHQKITIKKARIILYKNEPEIILFYKRQIK